MNALKNTNKINFVLVAIFVLFSVGCSSVSKKTDAVPYPNYDDTDYTLNKLKISYKDAKEIYEEVGLIVESCKKASNDKDFFQKQLDALGEAADLEKDGGSRSSLLAKIARKNRISQGAVEAIIDRDKAPEGKQKNLKGKINPEKAQQVQQKIQAMVDESLARVNELRNAFASIQEIESSVKTARNHFIEAKTSAYGVRDQLKVAREVMASEELEAAAKAEKFLAAITQATAFAETLTKHAHAAYDVYEATKEKSEAMGYSLAKSFHDDVTKYASAACRYKVKVEKLIDKQLSWLAESSEKDIQAFQSAWEESKSDARSRGLFLVFLKRAQTTYKKRMVAFANLAGYASAKGRALIQQIHQSYAKVGNMIGFVENYEGERTSDESAENKEGTVEESGDFFPADFFDEEESGDDAGDSTVTEEEFEVSDESSDSDKGDEPESDKDEDSDEGENEQTSHNTSGNSPVKLAGFGIFMFLLMGMFGVRRSKAFFASDKF